MIPSVYHLAFAIRSDWTRYLIARNRAARDARKTIPITAHAYDKGSDAGSVLRTGCVGYLGYHIPPLDSLTPKGQPMQPHYIRTERSFAGALSPAIARIEGYADKLSSLLYSDGQRVYKYVGEAKRIDTPGEKIAPKVGDELRTESGAIARIVSVNAGPICAIVGCVRNIDGYDQIMYWHKNGYPSISNHYGRLIFSWTEPGTRVALIGPDGNEVGE